MSKIIVIGHKNPDTDSIVSALGAAEYLRKVLGLDAEAYRAGEINNETKFVLEHIGVEVPPYLESASEDEAISLVDHNEVSQVAEGVDYSKVEYIFDHHKISLQTERPIFLRTEPIGSTASLIAKMFLEKGGEFSAKTAKLLLAGILSDTLNLTSPTATHEDAEISEKLNEIAKIDVFSFADEMFVAKSSLEGISIEDITTLDYKNFEMGGKKVGVGTWETTNPETVNEKKVEIAKVLEIKKEVDRLDYVFFMVADIIKQNSYLYMIGEEEKKLAEKVFKGKMADGIMFLEGVVSRKKQIIPPLTAELEK
ncbi:MAG: manganese-dependent inorganic pyrophosphatase [Candidatus Pacebacteria bacterium]|nr:manganese-dependent inorganic pyrophosphatase [Candidatus Paceibacterota bacterium]MDR3583642.1 manganese-dependent inorganic pyrophosphatase [Candidatus Paceibacterota bacterium]